MATNDGFPPDDSFPLFLSEHAEEPEQPGIEKTWDRPVISSRILKTSILLVTATAIDFAILSIGDPVALFANVTASQVDISALQPGTGQSMPTIQSTAGGQALPPIARDAPTRDEIAAAIEPIGQSQIEIRQPSVEDLLKPFQAWAAEEDARAQVEPVQPVQDARVQVVQNARAQVRPIQKHRQVRPVQNARAEIRPVQDARAQDRSEQNAQSPWLLQRLGWLN